MSIQEGFIASEEQEEIKTLYTSQSKQLEILEELKLKIDTLKI